MKRNAKVSFIVFIAIVVMMLIPAAGQSQRAREAGDPDYYLLVKQLKNNDMTINFQALRLSYARTPDYKPYAPDNNAKDAAFDAIKNKNLTGALKFAEAALETNYVDLDVHLLCKIAYRETGNSEKEAFHTSILKGLVNSLYNSGDGSTPEKAMTVISVAEEYFVLNANGLKPVKTKTLTVNGHDYDGIDAENKKTGERKTVYFNTDIPRQWLTKNLKTK